MTAIIRLVPLLTTIQHLEFTSQSGPNSRCAWSGQGKGTVKAVIRGNTIRFHERGHFIPEGHSRAVPFTNVYRWEVEPNCLRLFHERRGAEHAVWLFDLIEDEASSTLVSHDAHLCGDDRYSARLTPLTNGFDLNWHIEGPRKDEAIHYRYRHT